MNATEHKPRAIALAEYLESFRSFPEDQEAAIELRRLSAVEEGFRSQHDADSRELRNLCAARDEARRERDELRSQVAALQKRSLGLAMAFNVYLLLRQRILPNERFPTSQPPQRHELP